MEFFPHVFGFVTVVLVSLVGVSLRQILEIVKSPSLQPGA